MLLLSPYAKPRGFTDVKADDISKLLMKSVETPTMTTSTSAYSGEMTSCQSSPVRGSEPKQAQTGIDCLSKLILASPAWFGFFNASCKLRFAVSCLNLHDSVQRALRELVWIHDVNAYRPSEIARTVGAMRQFIVALLFTG